MGTAPGPEAIRAVQTVLRLQGHHHLTPGVVDQRVLARREAQRPGLPLGRGDGHPAERLMAVPLRPQPLVQVWEICLHVLPVLCLGAPLPPTAAAARGR